MVAIRVRYICVRLRCIENSNHESCIAAQTQPQFSQFVNKVLCEAPICISEVPLNFSQCQSNRFVIFVCFISFFFLLLKIERKWNGISIYMNARVFLHICVNVNVNIYTCFILLTFSCNGSLSLFLYFFGLFALLSLSFITWNQRA